MRIATVPWIATACATVLALAASTQVALAQQQIRCTSDLMGGQTCRDQDGGVYRVRPDVFGGGATIQDQDGGMTRIRPGLFGNTEIQGSDGSVLRGRADPFGGTTWQDDQGRSTRCHRSAFDLPGQISETCQDN